MTDKLSKHREAKISVTNKFKPHFSKISVKKEKLPPMFSSLGVLVKSSRGRILDYSIRFNVCRCYGLCV